MREKPENLEAIEGRPQCILRVEDDSYIDVMAMLVKCKRTIKRLEAQRDEGLAPAKETVTRIKGYFDESLDELASLEGDLKYRLTSYLERESQARLCDATEGRIVRAPPAPVDGVSIRESWSFAVDYPDLLPREYLEPSKVFIKAAMRRNDPPTPIEGVRFYRKTSLVVTTR